MLTIRLQLYPDFDPGFPRSEFLTLTNMRMYNNIGARKSAIEIGVELQSYRQRGLGCLLFGLPRVCSYGALCESEWAHLRLSISS